MHHPNNLLLFVSTVCLSKGCLLSGIHAVLHKNPCRQCASSTVGRRSDLQQLLKNAALSAQPFSLFAFLRGRTVNG